MLLTTSLNRLNILACKIKAPTRKKWGTRAFSGFVLVTCAMIIKWNSILFYFSSFKLACWPLEPCTGLQKGNILSWLPGVPAAGGRSHRCAPACSLGPLQPPVCAVCQRWRGGLLFFSGFMYICSVWNTDPFYICIYKGKVFQLWFAKR